MINSLRLVSHSEGNFTTSKLLVVFVITTIRKGRNYEEKNKIEGHLQIFKNYS